MASETRQVGMGPSRNDGTGLLVDGRIGGARLLSVHQRGDLQRGRRTARKRRGGAALILYAPLDTNLEGDPDKDRPWAGSAMRRDMIPRAVEEGDFVYGLGAAIPKCMIATLVEIATALGEARVPIRGDLIAAFAGGGTPVNLAGARRDGRRVRARPGQDRACEHVRGDRHAYALARGTWALKRGATRKSIR